MLPVTREEIAPMFAIDAFHQQYQTETRKAVIGSQPFRFYLPTSLDPFLDQENPLHQFPLWAKIWEASLVLAHRLTETPPVAGRRWLELGAGIGVVGIVAARFQHEVTITEYDPNALNFIRANAHLNKCKPSGILRLDWMKPELQNRFDRIVGSELIYNAKDFPALKALFSRMLNPEGEILLAGEMRRTDHAFLDLMQKDYHIEITRNTLRSDESPIVVLLTRMRPKNPSTGI
jgi:predicted nicotinamide N-methyase